LKYETILLDIDDRGVAAHLEASLSAVAATKKLIAYVDTHGIDAAKDYTAVALANAWETSAGREGTASFLEKLLPRWRSGT
jgi:methylglutaconyl-CoA hydratase